MRIEVKKFDDLPDSYVDHIQDLEQAFMDALIPLMVDQRKDIVIGALISTCSRTITTIFRDDVSFLTTNYDIWVKCFENHLLCSIENKAKQLLEGESL